MKELQSISVVAPGFAGVNTQDSSVTLPNSFALAAANCVMDKFGRLGARKGWQQRTQIDVADLLDGETLEFVFEHINADKTSTYLSGGNNKVFKGGYLAPFEDITPASYTITKNDWTAATLNDVAILVQEDHEPLVYSEGATPEIQTLGDYTGVAVQPFGTDYPTDIIAAYGRFWAHNGTNVYWSTDIADSDYPDFSAGSAGFLNINSVLPNNVDTIVALAAHNNFLIIFCKKSIVIYGGAENPVNADFALSDVINGVGCIARDSVQNTGSDLIFLSAAGVRSLGRIIQEKSLPMRDLTANVRDDLAVYVAQEFNTNRIKAIYSETEAFYLLSFPTNQTVFCLDMREALEDGTARVTTWEAFPVGAFYNTSDYKLLIGKPKGIGEYSGYLDDGETYRMRYESNHLDFQDSTLTKIVKNIKCVVIGGEGQDFIIRSGTDYEDFEFAYSLQVKEQGEAGQWNISEWNEFDYSIGTIVDRVFTPANGSGKTLQIGFETVIKGAEFSVQRLDVFVKIGRKS